VYDGTDLTVEYGASSGTIRRCIYGPGVDEPIVAYDTGATERYLMADTLAMNWMALVCELFAGARLLCER